MDYLNNRIACHPEFFVLPKPVRQRLIRINIYFKKSRLLSEFDSHIHSQCYRCRAPKHFCICEWEIGSL